MKNSSSESRLLPHFIGRIFGASYISSQFRMWRSSRRYKRKLAAVLNPIKGCTIRSNTFDISESGIFVSVREEDAGQLEPGQLIRLNLELNTIRHIRCEAVITRAVQASGSYPAGYGIQFIGLDSGERRRLKKFLQSA